MVKLLELDKQAMLMEMAGDARDNASILEKNEQLLIRAQEQLAESEEVYKPSSTRSLLEREKW